MPDCGHLWRRGDAGDAAASGGLGILQTMYKIEGPEDGGVAPKGPNFLLVVILFCAAIFVVLVGGGWRATHGGSDAATG